MDKVNQIGNTSQRRLRTASQRLEDAKHLPPITPLFGEVWQQGELHILFADTGLGKSIFAVALADALSKGRNFLGLANATDPQRVLYYDFELSDRQFRNRYSDDSGNSYHFADNFFIENIDFKEFFAEGKPKNFIEDLFKRIRQDLTETEAQILIIDNITFLSLQSPTDTDIALGVMRNLDTLKSEFNLSILVLAHTPKRSPSAPLSLNDLAGSKMISNFSDSVSAINRSCQDKAYRYLKQVKPSRSAELIYDADNVLICQIEKRENLLTFKAIETDSEYQHLPKETSTVTDHTETVKKAAELLATGKSYDETARELNISKGTISKWKYNPKYAALFVSVS
jgi:RecA-family ATPase